MTRNHFFDKCEKCKSDNLDFRSNYEWGEDWDPKREDNIILCNDCGYESDDSCIKNKYPTLNIEIVNEGTGDR